MELFQPKTSDVSQTCRLFTLYRINDQYRCVTEIVPDRGFVYTQDDSTVAFYATEKQYDALLFEVLQVPPHNFCDAPIASANSSTLHIVHCTTLQDGITHSDIQQK